MSNFFDLVEFDVFSISIENLMHTINHILNLLMLIFTSFTVQISKLINFILRTIIFMFILTEFYSGLDYVVSFYVIFQILSIGLKIFELNLDLNLDIPEIVRLCGNIAKYLIVGEFKLFIKYFEYFMELLNYIRYTSFISSKVDF
jgi:hypothetical protein